MKPPRFFAHPTALVESTSIGAGTRIWAYAHVLKGARIGRDCNLGDHAFVEGGAVIGHRVTIKNGVMIWDGVVLENDVFVGPAAVFTNDLRPRSPRGAAVKQRYDSNAVLRLIGELVGDKQLGDAIAIGIESGGIDHALEPARDHVPFPCWILEPDQIRESAGERDDVGFAIAVQVRDHYLIAALQIRGERVNCKVRGGLRKTR